MCYFDWKKVLVYSAALVNFVLEEKYKYNQTAEKNEAFHFIYNNVVVVIRAIALVAIENRALFHNKEE